VLGLSLLTVTYNRPEYLYALYLFAPLAVGATVFGLWSADSRRAVLGAVALFATGSALLVWALGSPRAEGGRPIIAFGQHYAYNQFLEGKGAENGSPWGQWENYIRADFGDATTVGGALRNNPGAFFWHVGTNAQRLPGALSRTATPRIDLSRLRHAHMFLNIPSRHPKSEALARRAVALVVGCGLVGVVIGLRRWRPDPGEVSALPVGMLMLGFVAAPAVAAALLIFPRYHYGIPSVVFAVALAAAGFRYLPRPERARTRTAERLALVAVVGALALFVPNRANGWCVQSRLWGPKGGQKIEPVPTPYRASVRAIRELDLRGEVVFLDLSGARSFYAGFGPTAVDPFTAQPGEKFLPFVRRTNVGVVVFEPHLLLFAPFRDDPDARALFEGKDSELFRTFPVDGYPDFRIAVRRDLLPPGR
jgi:hypothetical protein